MKLHISEQSGRGVPKIIKSYGRNAYEFRENSIVIKIPFNWINEVGNKVGNKPLNITRQNILSEIRNNRNITTKQLAVILGISETAVDKNLKFLKENGFIERKDSKKAA